jgi:hypothetical protein
VPEATFSPTIAGTVKLPELAPTDLLPEAADALGDADGLAAALDDAAEAAGAAVAAAVVAGAAVGEPCDAAGEPAGDPPAAVEAEPVAAVGPLELQAARPPPAARTATITAEAPRKFIFMVTLPLSN